MSISIRSVKMRRIRSAAASHVEGSDGLSTKGKRKPRQEEDEDYQRISTEEAKKVIEKAGMELTDEELDNVTGGFEQLSNNPRVVHLIRSNVTL